MKVVFSRKGFDSSAGGVASPILPDGTLVSLPIPDRTSLVRYHDLPLHRRLVADLAGERVQAHFGAHLDPDLVEASLPRLPGWRPLFGQCNAEQRVLERTGVGLGDLFLFFGWFRQVELRDGRYRYVQGAPDLHVLWGWMQVGAVLADDTDPIPAWAAYHPHATRTEARRSNTIYVTADRLTVGGFTTGMAGAGVFERYDDRLRLTAAGRSRSIWSLPGWFDPSTGRTPLGYHGDLQRWTRDGDRVLLQTVGRGQEFVLDAAEYPEVVPWVLDLIASDRAAITTASANEPAAISPADYDEPIWPTPPPCPHCGSLRVLTIMHGRAPLVGEPKEEDARFYSGGCLVWDEAPCWFCRNCKRKFGRYDEWHRQCLSLNPHLVNDEEPESYG